MVTKNDNTEAIRNPHAHPRASRESQWNALSNGTIIRDRNALDADEKAKEERNSHETNRTHITKNDNTKPTHLIHANPKPPRRSKLNASSICAIEREEQAWDEVVMSKRKSGKTDQKLTLTSSRHPNQTDPPPKHIEYLQHSKMKGVNQPNGTKTQRLLIEWQSTTEDRRKGENGPILLIFFDGHPKVLPKNHNPHGPLHCIPYGIIERIERKDGETMTKIEKRKRTPLTYGRPLPSEGSGLVSLWRISQNQPKNNGYIRHCKTVVMNVYKQRLGGYWCCGCCTWYAWDEGEKVMQTTEKKRENRNFRWLPVIEPLSVCHASDPLLDQSKKSLWTNILQITV